MSVQGAGRGPLADEQAKADPLELRAPRSSVARLSRKAILGTAVFFGLAIGAAVLASIMPGREETFEETDPSFKSADPARLNELPTDYAHLGEPGPALAARRPEPNKPVQEAALVVPPPAQATQSLPPDTAADPGAPLAISRG